MVKHLEKEEDFANIVQNGLVLVDFYAEWCGPCQMLAPVLEDIDFMEVLKVDTDKFMNLATKHGIMSIPTLCFYKDGQMVERTIGFKNLEEIKEIYTKISSN